LAEKLDPQEAAELALVIFPDDKRWLNPTVEHLQNHPPQPKAAAA
jgi:hypothetical protein